MRHSFAALLRAHGLGKYAEAFARNDIDLDVIAMLSERDLAELGVSLGDRKRLQRMSESLSTPDASNAQGEQDSRDAYERAYRGLVDNAIYGIAVHDADNRLLFVNQAFAKIFGYDSIDEIAALDSPAAVIAEPEMHAELVARRIDRLAGEAVPSDIQFEGKRKDGSRFWVLCQSRRIQWMGEAAVQSLYLDITAQKTVERELRQSEQRFRDFAEAASDWLWEMDEELRFSYLSDAFEGNLGWKREQLLGRRKHDIYREIANSGARHEQEHWRRHFADLEARRPFSNFLQRWITPSGDTRYILNSGKPIYDDSGRFAGYRGTASNVTDLVFTQEALRASNHRYQLLVEALPAIVITLTPDARIDYINPYFEQLTGYEIADVRGRDWFDTFLPERDRPKIRGVFEDAIDGVSSRGNVNPIVTRDGEERTVEWSDAVLRDQTGKVTSLLAIGTDITEREQAREALAASERRYRAMLEGVTCGVILFDPDYRPLYANKVSASIFGYDGPEEIMALPTLTPLTDPTEVKRLKDIRQRRFAGEAIPGTSEIKCRRKDGSPVWLLQTATVVDWAGHPAIQSTFTDITASKVDADRLQRQTALLNGIVETLPAHVSLRDSKGRFLFVNKALADNVGFAAEDMLGYTLAELGGIQTSTSVEDLAFEVLRTGVPVVNRELEPPRVPGRIFLTNVLPFGSWDGGTDSVLCVSLDITAQKRAERELWESEAGFRAVLEHSPFSLMLKELDGAVRLVNSTFESWFGLSRSQVVGKRSHGFHGVEVAERMEELDAQVIERRGAVEAQVKLTLADDAEHLVRLTKFPVLDSDGEVVRIGSIGVDETERSRLEERLRQVERLQAVGQLAGGIAHEFNNMMQVILGNAELLTDTVKRDPESSSRLQALRRTALRSSELTGRLLTFSRRQALSPQATSIAELVNDTIVLLSRTLGENIEVEADIPASVWNVFVDQGQLQNALVNLALNARDAMPEGGRLIIRAENRELTRDTLPPEEAIEEGPYLRLTVSDTGIGMSAQVRTQAFEPFFSTKAVGAGSGLGLSIVYGFAHQSGGFAELDSSVEHGTSVSIYLPRHSSDVATEDASGEITTLQDLGGARIMVVEDNAAVRETILDFLKRQQLTVEAYASGAEALRRLERGPVFDLVISDVVMPGEINGFALARWLRRNRPEAGVVLVSGYNDLRNRAAQSDKKPGDVPLVSKPFSNRTLAVAIDQALAQRL